jgi:hypothetical protein
MCNQSGNLTDIDLSFFVKILNFQKRFSIFPKTILVSFDIAPCPIRHSPYSTLPLTKKPWQNTTASNTVKKQLSF